MGAEGCRRPLTVGRPFLTFRGCAARNAERELGARISRRAPVEFGFLLRGPPGSSAVRPLPMNSNRTRASNMNAEAETIAQTHPFQAEVAELLRLMVHAVYSETDVFLRE